MMRLTALAQALTRRSREAQLITSPDGGIAVTARASGEARTLDGVYRAVSIIETSIAQLGIDAYGIAGTARASLPVGLRTQDLAPGVTHYDLIAETAASLALRGNAYLDARPGHVRVLDPLRCSAHLVGPGRDRREVRYDGVARRDIVHARLTHVPGEAMGLGPLQAADRDIQASLDIADYGSRWTDRSGRPLGVVETDQPLSPEQAEQWQARVNAKLTPEHGVAVLGSGLTFRRYLLTPSELQLLESRKWSTTMVARVFGIPARLMLTSADGDSKTYANLEQENLVFIRHTLTAYIRAVEMALSEIVAPYSVRLNADALMRADTTTRYHAHAAALGAGWITPNEIRAIEGLGPLPGGDELRRPTTPQEDSNDDDQA